MVTMKYSNVQIFISEHHIASEMYNIIYKVYVYHYRST